MGLHWVRKDYFDSVLRCNGDSISALEMLVDDLHLDREKTVINFLAHVGSEDFLWALVKLLSYNDVRVAGNAAYILGMLAESELGCYRILNLLKRNTVVPGRNALLDLLDMLQSDDTESVMNAAGTIGTLAETNEGRDWMIEEKCVNVLLSRMASLLDNENIWTASNAALVLARLTISMMGSGRILNHDESNVILAKLTQALGLDEAARTMLEQEARAVLENYLNDLQSLSMGFPFPRRIGRGMNAAFAIGRLCDLDAGRNRLLEMPDSDQMISSLARMLSRADAGASKNACFALSCLSTTPEGHARFMKNCDLDSILITLTELLVAVDHETCWFAAMTMRTIASQPAGCLRVRAATNVTETLKELIVKEELSSDLRDEILATLEILKRLEKPHSPRVTGARMVFFGKELATTLTNLDPCTQYTIRIRAVTEGDESPFSDYVLATTEEMPPTAPTQLRVIGATTTQLKLLWEPPEKMNGPLKGYYVYCEKKFFEHTNELTSIITGLQPSTRYDVSVCGANSKGKGERAHATGETSELGAHAPARPTVSVLGRNEISIAWEAPENPTGKINRYDLSMNGKIIYSGTDFNYTAYRLQPDTDYTFTVSALTHEGRCESKPTKKRTSKDEYDDSVRAPLYSGNVRRGSDSSVKATNRRGSVTRRRKSTTDVRIKPRVTSAKPASEDAGSKQSTSTRVAMGRRASLQMTQYKTEAENEAKTAAKPLIVVSTDTKSMLPKSVPSIPRYTETIPETQEPVLQKPNTIEPSSHDDVPLTSDAFLIRSFTTLNLKAPSGPPKPPISVDTADVSSRTRSHSIPAAFLKRANTFAGNHRPGIQKNMNRYLSGQSFKEEYANSRPLPAHLSTKFVPMQMRTQPANLPHSLRRSLSNVRVGDPGEVNLRNLDPAFGRTNPYDLKQTSIEGEIERLAVCSRRARDHRAETSGEEILNKPFTGYRYPKTRQDQRNTAVQSAR